MSAMERQDPTIYDVVVVGGGAAGLSGALMLGRSRRSVLVIDAGEPRNAPAAGVHGFLTRDGMAPAALLEAGREEVRGYGVQVLDGRVTSAKSVEGGFTVGLEDGSQVGARRLLVTTGLVDELPDVAGVRERWGHDVLHCPYCHGWEVQDQQIGILGTGPMAVHQVLMFRQLSDDVILFQHTSPILSAEQAEQLAARGIPVVEGEVASLEVQDDQLTGVRLRNGEFVARRAVVVAPRFVARAEVLNDLGLETAEKEISDHVLGSYVPADATGATAVPGVWVAGNVADPFGQVVSAANQGAQAGAHINADLISEDTQESVEAHRSRMSSAAEKSAS